MLNLLGNPGLPGAIAQLYKPELPPRPEPQPLPLNGPLAYLPYINKEAYALSMKAYRRYVAKYNTRVHKANKDRLEHNKKVVAHVMAAQDPVIFKYIEMFSAQNAHLGPWEYNRAALEACEKYGPIIALDKIQTVKPNSEQYFSLFLYVYGLQVQRSTDRVVQFYPSKNVRPLPPFEVNARNIARIKREGDVYSLPVCKDSVINHRERLQEAGVLVNYAFRGSYRGVHLQINPEILVFFDLETGKLTGTDIQSLMNDRTEELPDVLVSTRTSKRIEKSKRGKSVCVDKDAALPRAFTLPEQPSRDIYQNTALCNVEKKSPGAAAEMLNFEENKHSAALKALIIDPETLCAGLASGKYDDYKPLDQAVFDTEVYGNGTLTNEEFVTLFVQNLLKLVASRLYKGRRDNYAGAWHNTYNHLLTQFGRNGRFQAKANMASWYPEYLWRVSWAKTWFERESRKAKKAIVPDFISRYFNVYRKGKQCVGFAYTGQKWKERQLKLDPEKKLKQQAEKEAQRLKARSSNMRKYEAKMQEYFIGKITIDKMFDYIEKNLPLEYMTKATETIIKRAEKVGMKVSFE